MFTNTYCMYKYPVASLTLNHAITVTTKDRKPSLNLCKFVIPSCHEYVTALPGDSRGSDRHTGRVFNQAGVVVILSTQMGKESKLCEHMRTWVRGREENKKFSRIHYCKLRTISMSMKCSKQYLNQSNFQAAVTVL